MRTLIATLAALFFSHMATAPKTISLPTEDGGVIFADVYGTGDRGVVLAHGGPFSPGQSDPMNAPLHLDVLAAVRYLRENGAKSVSVVGGSMGGEAAGDASIASQPGEIDRLVLLGAAPNGPADKLKSSTLYMVARDDADSDGPRLPQIRKQYEKSPQPKELIVLDGSAHAQFLFQTDQGERVMREILRFLLARSTTP